MPRLLFNAYLSIIDGLATNVAEFHVAAAAQCHCLGPKRYDRLEQRNVLDSLSLAKSMA